MNFAIGITNRPITVRDTDTGPALFTPLEPGTLVQFESDFPLGHPFQGLFLARILSGNQHLGRLLFLDLGVGEGNATGVTPITRRDTPQVEITPNANWNINTAFSRRGIFAMVRNGMVTVNIDAIRPNAQMAHGTAHNVAVLPIGMRPAHTINAALQGGHGRVRVVINANGNINFRSEGEPMNTTSSIFGTITFPVA